MVQATATATYYDVVAGNSTTGSQLLGITLKGVGTTSAGLVKLWLYDGTNRRLLTELYVTAITTSNTVAGWFASYNDPYLFLNTSSWKIQAEISVTNTIDIIARVEDV
jgi:hypothetical protein